MSTGSPAAGSAGAGSVVGSTGRLGRGSAVLAFVLVQVIVFALAYTAGRTGLYVFFALGSAATVGYLSRRGWFAVVAASLGAILLIAVGLPIVMFVARQQPSLVIEKALSTEVHRMLYLSIYGPLLAALFTVVFGTPLAYLLSEGFPGDTLIESLVDLPLVVPHSVAGLVILFGFGGGGAFPSVFVLGTMIGLVLAMAFVSAPFAVNVIREAFETIDVQMEYAARVHGANRFETFRRVTFPLSARSVVTGGVLAWARAVSEFGAVAVVAYNVQFFYPPAGGTITGQHAPVFIFNTYTAGSLAESSAVGFILLVVSVLIFLLIRWLAYGEDDTSASAMP
jgi:molybdate/tungstate transport system permease protein